MALIPPGNAPSDLRSAAKPCPWLCISSHHTTLGTRVLTWSHIYFIYFVRVHHVAPTPTEDRRKHWLPWIRGEDGCELLCERWGSKPGPPEERPTVLTAEL